MMWLNFSDRMGNGKERKMDIFKRAPKPDDSPEHPNTGRRSFMWKIGAGMSTVLAFAVPGMSKPGIDRDTELKIRVDQLSHQLGILEIL